MVLYSRNEEERRVRIEHILKTLQAASPGAQRRSHAPSGLRLSAPHSHAVRPAVRLQEQARPRSFQISAAPERLC
jgi:hypothetical protein